MTTSNERKPLNLILAIVAILYLAFIVGTSFVVGGERYFTLVDDAMISMRYARHLTQGHGLVWNIGDAPVEGFTNLGWTLYLAFLHLFPIPVSKISLAVMLTSAVILLANVYVVWQISARLLPDSKHAPTLAALVTAFYFPLVFWSLRGMEVGLLVLLIDLSILASISSGYTQKKTFLVGILLSLAILVRLDAVIAAVLIAAYLFAKDKRSSVVPAVAIVLATLGILWFQQVYFGSFLPITYYQKVTGFSALDRIRNGILVFNQFATRDTLFLFLFSLAALFFYKSHRNREALLLMGIFLTQCVYSIYVGGDYAEPETNAANRFITQGMPALILLFSWMTSRMLADLKVGQSQSAWINPAIPLALGVLLIVSGEPWFMYSIDNAPLLKADIRRVKLGLHIAQNTSPEAVIAVHAAGQIPYYSERTTIDLLGLNDPVVAMGEGHGEFYPGHNKWDYDYSIGELQPDVIADNFEPLPKFMQGNQMYTKLKNGIYVRNESMLADANGLSKEYR